MFKRMNKRAMLKTVRESNRLSKRPVMGKPAPTKVEKPEAPVRPTNVSADVVGPKGGFASKLKSRRLSEIKRRVANRPAPTQNPEEPTK